MNLIITILLTILIIGLLIFIHELGHYAAARKFGVTIKEFAVGMGPKVYSRVSPKTSIRYSLRVLPIGGYVSMVGEDETSSDPNALNKKPVWQRMIVMAAGGVTNVLFAFLIMIIVVAARGNIRGTTVDEFRTYNYTYYDQQGNRQQEERPFSYSSEFLLSGDRITHVNGRRVRDFMELNYVLARLGETVIIWCCDGEECCEKHSCDYCENGEYTEYCEDAPHCEDDSDGICKRRIIVQRTTTADLRIVRNGEQMYIENVTFRAINDSVRSDFFPQQIPSNLFTIIRQSYQESIFIMRMFYDGIWDMISGRVGLEDMAGPIGMGTIVGETIERGVVQALPTLLFLTTLISFNLGLLNLIPFPAFDGGRLVFLAIEGIRRKPIKPEIEGMIHFGGFVLLMVLMLVLTVSDIGRLR
ncbi:MAG: site-2 protease family protein [Oscillospiraceae bacterium]|nr:site-2 protease family protein [Oscillospiraceae bacterium]